VTAKEPSVFRQGFKDGLPIGIGYFSVAFSFGIAAVSSGISWWQAVLISFTNLTSSGQFAGIGLIASSASYIEMALTEFVINMRYTLMGISLSQKLSPAFKMPFKLTLGHCNTDEIFAVAMSRQGEVSPAYMGGLSILPYVGWTGGTLAGAVLGNILPFSLSQALGIMIYGMFMAIIIPAARRERPVLFVVLTSVIISCIIYFVPVFSFITSGFSIIICAVAASALAAWLHPVEGEVADEA
jgi:predicted branched-subunit amino acid permease